MTIAIRGRRGGRAAWFAVGAGAVIFLSACGQNTSGPQSAFTPVPVSPVLGDVPMGRADAPVEMIEYAALTCSHCRDFAKQTLPRLKREYIDTGKLRYIYRDFPLEADPETGKAASGFGVVLSSIARCKGADHFHEMLDAIFTAQVDILQAAQRGEAGTVLGPLAEKHGLTLDEATTCMDHHPELNASIRQSRDDAVAKFNVSSTPSIFIDGVRVENPTYDNLVAAIDARLTSDAPPASTTEPGGTAPTTPAP